MILMAASMVMVLLAMGCQPSPQKNDERCGRAKDSHPQDSKHQSEDGQGPGLVSSPFAGRPPGGLAPRERDGMFGAMEPGSLAGRREGASVAVMGMVMAILAGRSSVAHADESADGGSSADASATADGGLPPTLAPFEPTAAAPPPAPPPALAPLPPPPPIAAPLPEAKPLPPATSRADGIVQSKVYGFLNVQLERPSARGGATPYDARFRVVDGGSRIGYAGTVAVTTTTSALWQLEGALSGFEQGGITDQAVHTSIVSRNSYVGIENRCLGRLVAGNNDSAYRRLVGSGGDMGGNLGLTVLGLDLWNNTSAQFSGNGKSTFGRGEERYHNSVHYVSPAWQIPHLPSSLQLAGSYGFDQALVQAARRDRFALAALYRFGGFSLGAAFDRQANTGVDVDTLGRGFGLRTDALNGIATYYYEVLASFHVPRFGTYVGLGVERTNYGFLLLVPPTNTGFYTAFNRGVMRQTGVMGSLAQPIGKATLMVSVGGLSSLSNAIYGSGADYRSRQYSFGAKYAFTDHFGAYAYFSAIQNRAQQDVNLGAPIYSNNLGTAQAYLAPGDKPRTGGLGALVRF